MNEIRRILVVLEPASAQGDLPALATSIAARISAQINAILIQDATLMTAAELPFAQEILAVTGARRSLTRDSLDVDFQVLARHMALRFERSAGRAGLRWDLRSVRGEPIGEITAASAECDLFLLGEPRNTSFSLEAVQKIADAVGRPAIILGDPASLTGALSVLNGETEDLPSVLGLLAPAFVGAPTIYHRPSVTERMDLLHRNVLVLPRRPPGSSGGVPKLP